jgi:hypothetical protein
VTRDARIGRGGIAGELASARVGSAAHVEQVIVQVQAELESLLK